MLPRADRLRSLRDSEKLYIPGDFRCSTTTSAGFQNAAPALLRRALASAAISSLGADGTRSRRCRCSAPSASVSFFPTTRLPTGSGELRPVQLYRCRHRGQKRGTRRRRFVRPPRRAQFPWPGYRCAKLPVRHLYPCKHVLGPLDLSHDILSTPCVRRRRFTRGTTCQQPRGELDSTTRGSARPRTARSAVRAES